MLSRSKLNPDAKSFDYERPPVSQDFKEFFSILLTNWGSNNIDSIVSRIETIKSIGTAQLLFEELFKIIYDLTTQSGTGLKVDNIIIAIDTFDNQLPQLIIENSQNSASEVLQNYYDIRKNSFEHCFKRIFHSFELVVETNSLSFLKELKGVLLVLAKISKIFYYHDYVFTFLKYLWDIFTFHRDNEQIVLCILQTISMTIERILSLLLFQIDPQKNVSELIEGRERSLLAAHVLFSLKMDVIHKKFTREMIVIVLHILDQHDRYIGQFVDAIPENTLHDDGYILCSSSTRALEEDDVYEDFEEFLKTT